MQTLMLDPAAVEARARRILVGLGDLQQQLINLRSCTEVMMERLREREENADDAR
jgi:hypothetical protein